MGGGPAGAVAAAVLARAGARVRVIDRAVFPRDKLCGDTVNPGTLATLRRLGLSDGLDARALRVDGMRVSGDGGIFVDGLYPSGTQGLAILRRDLDWILLQHAIAAGCDHEIAVTARRAIVDDQRGSPRVTGIVVDGRGGDRTLDAKVVIAADGRRSAIGFGLGLARHPRRPRRWAVGAYFDVADQGQTGGRPRGATLGEMHVRRNCYIGVAPVPGGLTNVCLVKPSHAGDPQFANAAGLLTDTLAGDAMLRARFADARLVAPPVVLGPLAVDVAPAAIDGLLFAGDAAGFIDPMTGDGLRFAVQGGELAARAALQALEHGWSGVHARLADERRRAFAGKWRFNRVLRALVASPRSIGAAALASRAAPALMRAVIARAGDCGIPVHDGG